MSLFIPTSRGAAVPPGNRTLAKGQIYNLDNDQYLGFQYNPTSFEWDRQIMWAEQTWRGDTTGGDMDFINLGPHKFDLSLLYLADPGAAGIDHATDEPIVNGLVPMDFQAIIRTLDGWTAVVPAKGRPARVRVIVGPNYFDGAFLRLGYKITEFFEDLSAREALVNFEFREWRLVA